MISRKEVEARKKKFRPGMRIRIQHMEDEQAPPSGTEGTVIDVDDIGSVLMKWDNGSSLSLIPDEDEYEIM